ncbi:MAG TPA: hypothetical protein P5229_00990 [Candidatus Gracilibacteria bacterium]|nr:hypothetical protein [Candidatus Gracilibacteria bacterium]
MAPPLSTIPILHPHPPFFSRATVSGLTDSPGIDSFVSSFLSTMNEDTTMNEDISREGLTTEKICQLGRLFLASHNHAIVKVSEFRKVNLPKINHILGTEYAGAICDVDECMAPHHGEILPENIDAVTRMVKTGFNVAIYSNMKAGGRYEPFVKTVREKTGYQIPVVTSRFAKPDKRGFLEAKEALSLGKEGKAVMIGDNFVTDGGCIHAGIPFIQVAPILTPETFFKKLKRMPQTGSRRFYSWLSRAYDTLLDRYVLTDEDLKY